MKGKYAKKKSPSKAPRGLLIAVIICLAAVCAVVGWMLHQSQLGPADVTDPTGASGEVTDGADISDTTDAANTTDASNPTDAVETAPARLDALEAISIDLGSGMRITDVGKYAGIYMEDGSDEIVSGIMMIAVTNEGTDTIQYAEITMPVGDQTAVFSLSTLPAGSTVILLEQNRMEYVAGEYTTAAADNVVLFSEPLSLCEDQLKIQILDGAISVSNISGQDITGDIVIYYKNSAVDVFYGGITYRVRLEGGLKADEIRQIIASHFSASGSTIMFVTCGEG